MSRRKPEPIRQIQHPPSEEYPEGIIEEQYMGGISRFLDIHGNPFPNNLAISDEQLEAWKKMPKEEATKKILELINTNGLEISEKRFVLDAIWKLAELHGATQPVQSQSTQVMVVEIVMPGQNNLKHLIETTPHNG